jgi:hypothetical protein
MLKVEHLTKIYDGGVLALEERSTTGASSPWRM